MSKKVASIFDNKNDDDQPEHHHQQAFFAGGSEHSGQQILGPDRGANLIQNLLNDAQRHVEPNADPSNESLLVTLYRNGFTVGEDSELRDYESNRDFLTYIRQGEVPPELSARVRGGQIDVKLDNKAHKDYEPIKDNKRPVFVGEGFRLGVPTPAVVSETQSSSTAAQSAQPAPDSSQPSLDAIRQARLARFGHKPKKPEE